jgi:hypothetical protein
MHEENCGERLFAGSVGKGARETIIADTACIWLCEVEGAVAGVGTTGDEGAFCAAQHGMLQQCFTWPQHGFCAGDVSDIATIGWAAIRNPSSITTAILVIFKTMLLRCSFRSSSLTNFRTFWLWRKFQLSNDSFYLLTKLTQYQEIDHLESVCGLEKRFLIPVQTTSISGRFGKVFLRLCVLSESKAGTLQGQLPREPFPRPASGFPFSGRLV